MKANKSYTKRLRVTKSGTIIGRKPGGNHFLAKERRQKQLQRKGLHNVEMTSRAQRRFLPGTTLK